ncbi:hypothetical protein EON65_02075 [archaeon]|nr:MAG: hypothetical protein EON65_02075 [archaeon]
MMGETRTKQIPAGSLVAFKILQGESPDLLSLSAGQTDQDWSGIYAQFRVDHAIWYLTNHYDRGAESASLVVLRNKVPLTAIIIQDEGLKHSSLSSRDKANIVRDIMHNLYPDQPHLDASLPLMQSIGQAHSHFFIALHDAEELECVFPHSLFSEDVFDSQCLYHFERNKTCTYMTNTYTHTHTLVCVRCSKMEKEDVRVLAENLYKQVLSNEADWYI